MQHYPDKLLEYAPEGMSEPDALLLRTDERVRESFAHCLQHAYRRGACGMAKDVAVLGSRWRTDVSGVQCRWVCYWAPLAGPLPLTAQGLGLAQGLGCWGLLGQLCSLPGQQPC